MSKAETIASPPREGEPAKTKTNKKKLEELTLCLWAYRKAAPQNLATRQSQTCSVEHVSSSHYRLARWVVASFFFFFFLGGEGVINLP